MNLINKLNEKIPNNTIELTLMVNSVPGILSDLQIWDSWVGSGVWFRYKTNEDTESQGHFRCGIWRTYSNYLKGCIEACSYFSARGIKANIVDTKAEGKYISVDERTE
jgi:hypothetical protein